MADALSLLRRLFSRYGWPTWACLVTVAGAFGQWQLHEVAQRNQASIERGRAQDCVDDWELIDSLHDFGEVLVTAAGAENDERAAHFRQLIAGTFPEPDCDLLASQEVLDQ